MALEASPHVKQEDLDDTEKPMPEADTYFVVLSRDCPGVYLYRPPNTALGLHLEILPIVVICCRRSEALRVHQLNTEIIAKLQDPRDPDELRNAIHRSYTTRIAFQETAKEPFYALRIAQQTGIYHGFDWNTEILPVISGSVGPEFKSHDVFGEALLWMLNKEHLWQKFKVKPTNQRFVEDGAPASSKSAPLLRTGGPASASIMQHPGSAPPSPVKARARSGSLGKATSTAADRVELPSFPVVDADHVHDSVSAARTTTSRAGSPVKPRAASPTKLSTARATSPTKAPTSRAGSPVKQASSGGRDRSDTRPSTPTRGFPTTTVQDRPLLSVRGGGDFMSAPSPARARARAERAWILQQVIDVSDDEGDDQAQPSAPILDHLRTVIRPAGLLTDDSLIFDLGSSMDVWLAARRLPPVAQVYILQAFLWSANLTVFTVAAGQAPLELSVRDAEYVWRLLATWVASK